MSHPKNHVNLTLALVAPSSVHALWKLLFKNSNSIAPWKLYTVSMALKMKFWSPHFGLWQMYILFSMGAYKLLVVTPRAHARARGYVIGRGVYIYIYCKSGLFFGTNLLSPKILTFRGLF